MLLLLGDVYVYENLTSAVAYHWGSRSAACGQSL